MAFHDGTNGKTWWKNGGNPWIPEVHLLWIAGFHLVDFPTTHSRFQHECLAKSKVAPFFRQIKWWVMGFLSHRLPMEISMGFSGCNSLKKNRCPASRARHRWRRRFWICWDHSNPVILRVISPTRSEKNWSFWLIGWRFGTWMDVFFLLGME